MGSPRGSGIWPTRRSRVLDILLAVSAGLLDGALMWAQPNEYLPGPAVACVSALLGLTLVVRRRFPEAVTVVMIVAGVAAGAGLVSVVIAFYTLGAYAASRRWVTIISVLAVCSTVIQPQPSDQDHSLWVTLLVAVVVVTPPVLLGLYMGTRKQLIASLRERTARLERERDLLAERARAEERTRIAREMHDVVANRVSVMVVHSGALKAIVARDPGRAAETAAVIGDMGRQALDELRQVIGVLRLGEAAGPQPTPEMADIRELVDQSSATGLQVTLCVEGTDRPLPAAAARAMYRVVQESLTNVHKHAGDTEATVTLRRLPEALEMIVENAAPSAGPDHGLPSGGNGLIGLRERVTALGGTFEAGPAGSGGFAVRARIPLPAPV